MEQNVRHNFLANFIIGGNREIILKSKIHYSDEVVAGETKEMLVYARKVRMRIYVSST